MARIRTLYPNILATLALLFVVNPLSAAPTRYDYVGPNFTDFLVSADYPDAPYDTSMRLSGYVVLSAPLMPDADYMLNDLGIVDFAFSDGTQTLNFDNASMSNEHSDLRFTTDPSGLPEFWNAIFTANMRPGESYFPARIQTLFADVRQFDFPPFPFFDGVDSAARYHSTDPNCSAPFCLILNTGYRAVDFLDPDPVRGIWSLHPVPLPATILVFASGVAAISLCGRRRR